MTCDPWDVVIVPFPFTEKKRGRIVPFPFTEKTGAKRRPALVLNTRDFNENGHMVLAMITIKSHSPWPGDVLIEDLSAAGLHTPYIVRLKMFTLDNRLIIRRSSRLSDEPQNIGTQSE